MLLIESQTLLPHIVLSEAIKHGGLCIETCENYQKKSLRNKFFTSSAQGRVSTSIPLKKGKANKMPITDVSISYDTDWVDILNKLLLTNYSSGAYFEHYYQGLMDIFSSKYEKLYELNNALLIWLLKSINLELEVTFTTSYTKDVGNRIFDWRNNKLSFYENHSSNNQLVYDQIFEKEHGFISTLSTLDLLFNRGPESGYLITQSVNRNS